MKKFYSKNEQIINTALMIGMISFILTFLTTFFMQSGKMTILKVSFLPLIFGFFYFFTFVIISIYNLNIINLKIYQAKEKQSNKFKQLLMIIIISFGIYYILDSIVFFIDDSLSKDYANGILAITENPTQKDIKEIDDLSKLPFSTQNFVFNFVSAFFSLLFSFIFVKKFKD
jgi:hypothetical protein